jgi:hypothetical protein
MCSGVTLTPVGADIVNIYVNGCEKADFTCIAAVQASGTKLPLVMLAKGVTNQCHTQFENAGVDPSCIMHCQRGWCNEKIVQQYLSWLRQQIPDGDICLIWDQYRSHMTMKVMQLAQRLHIFIIYGPNGGTGLYQPLDRNVFGALKSVGLSKFNRFIHDNPDARISKELSAAILLDSWNSISENVMRRAWDFDLPGDKPGKESDDDDDPEFFLTENDPTE